MEIVWPATRTEKHTRVKQLRRLQLCVACCACQSEEMLKEWIDSIFGGDLPFWANVSQIVGVVGIIVAVVALFFGWRQLRLTERATYNQLILMIDDAFYNFDDVRIEINRKHKPRGMVRVSEAEWFRYMAIFERVGLVLGDKLCDKTTVNVLYGDRFERLVKANLEPPLTLRPKVAPQNWPGFIYLWKKLAEVREGVELPEELRN